MGKLKTILTNVRVIILLVFILFAIVALSPNPFAKGVTIRTVAMNSSAAAAGIKSPESIQPMSKERILAMNNVKITNTDDYYRMTSNLVLNTTLTIKTTKGLYTLKIKESNITGKAEDLGLRIYNAPSTNIRKGLDLEGGTRVLMKPEEKLKADELESLVANMKERLNVYGLSDVVVRGAIDLSGNQYVVVEIAGVNEEEVKELLSKQGKFEAKIGNKTVFRGGNDITYVCRSAECSGLDPQKGCGQADNMWYCGFRFSISLSQEAAQRQAEATKNLAVVTQPNSEPYLNETLDLYLDDQQVDTLNIGADLKGKAATDIQISGSAMGAVQQEAVSNTLKSMKRLQTVLITGSLPVKLEIIKTDNISPLLGQQFMKNAFLVGAAAIIAVVTVLLIAYRKPLIALPIMFCSLLEIFLMLGIAAFIGWNIDLAAIAGIIAAVGTGVNDQIVITDEILHGETRAAFSWKQKLKNAFFIVIGAWLTLTVAMIPLLFAGAGLLRGFALTTIIGITVGVAVTRPAYAQVVEILMKE